MTEAAMAKRSNLRGLRGTEAEHRQVANAMIDLAETLGVQAIKAKSCKKRWHLLLAKREAAIVAGAEGAWVGGPEGHYAQRARGLQLSAEVGLTQMARFGCKAGTPLAGKKHW